MNKYFIKDSNIILREILNKEENIDILKDFIESILQIKVEKLSLRQNSYSNSNNNKYEQKNGIVNFRITDKDNNQYNIGIQIVEGMYPQEKILVYGASIHANQNKYEFMEKLVDTITINILDYKVFLTPHYHKIIEFPTEETEIGDKLIFHILQLPDYKKSNPETKEEEWIQYLKGEEDDTIEELKNKNIAIQKLDEELVNYWKNERI